MSLLRPRSLLLGGTLASLYGLAFSASAWARGGGHSSHFGGFFGGGFGGHSHSHGYIWYGGSLTGILDDVVILVVLGALLYLQGRRWRRRSASRAASLAGVRNSRGVTGQVRKAAEEAERIADLASADDPYWGAASLRQRTREVFFAVQDAWAQRDIVRAARYLSDAELARQQRELETLAARGQVNHVEDMELVNVRIVRVFNVEDDGKDVFVAYVVGCARDWIVNTSGVTVDGNPRAAEQFTEYWTFARDDAHGWVLDRIQQEREGAYHLTSENTNEDYGPAVFERPDEIEVTPHMS
jgi:predicted lipid-binding transport protein (Tim44 family)